MNTNFIIFKPQSLQAMKSLYVNLINDKNIVIEDINQLSILIQNLIENKTTLDPINSPIPVSRASDQAIGERIQELKGFELKFKTTQLAIKHSEEEVLHALEGLAIQLKYAGVKLIKRGHISIDDCCSVYYDEAGRITSTLPDLGLNGVSALEMIAGMCAQDFGLVIERDHTLIYLYGSARYEKTPKHVESGHDYFIGEDFLEWHRRIPVWGPTLAMLFERLYLAFKQASVDSLVVDLKGRNCYTNETLVLQRYERDYALPLPTLDGETIGMIVFADSLFKDIHDELSPFFGGTYLDIQSPRQFHDNFHLIKDPSFCHHPFGMRNQKGEQPIAHDYVKHE